MILRTSSSLTLLCIGLGLVVACGGDDPQVDEDEVVVIIAPECTTDADCADNSVGPVCMNEECTAGCLSDADCTEGENTKCIVSVHVCVAPEPEVIDDSCKSDADCAQDPAGPVCNLESGECEPFVCMSHQDCDGETPVCEEDTGQCIAGCLLDEDCTDAAMPVCDTELNQCIPVPVATLIGKGDGSVESVNFTKIYEPRVPIESTDLEFHPERDELWVLNREFEVQGECTQANPNSARCNSLWGSTTIITQPGTLFQQEEVRIDANSWHFMRRPTALAMGARETFGTCGEAATGNFEDNNVNFIGPSLWSTDLEVYARPSGGNGSHLDMLHATPWCMGMAHERDNVYWVFNGDVGAIDRYDFHEDHGPGADDHSDGEIHRYIPGEVSRVPNVPSHMVFHEASSQLYIVDTGNGRLIRLDTTTGTMGAPFTPVYEPLASYGFMDDAVVAEVVNP